MNKKDAFHFHRLSALRLEFVKMKERAEAADLRLSELEPEVRGLRLANAALVKATVNNADLRDALIKAGDRLAAMYDPGPIPAEFPTDDDWAVANWETARDAAKNL